MKSKKKITNEIWLENEEYIRRLCSLKLKDREDDIDDCLHEIFLALSESVAQNKKIDNPKAWLTGVAYHKISDIYTEEKKNKLFFTRFDSHEIDKVYSLSMTTSCEEYIRDDEEIRRLKEAVISRLDEDESCLLKDKYEFNKSVAVIAEENGITQNNVYQKLYRLRIKVKMIIENVLNE